jgi:small subunit ribosomal protein S1
VKIAVGQVVSGTVSRIETFGVFLQIEGTKGREGRGLVPLAELGVPRGTDLRKKFPEGTKLTAKVLDISEGKMRLSLRAMKDDEERKQFEGFKKEAPTPGTMGTLGDLLKKSGAKKPRA